MTGGGSRCSPGGIAICADFDTRVVLMYLRMGFLILPEFYSENVVAYPSKRFKQIVIKEIGQDAWNEWAKHSLENRKAWGAIQKSELRRLHRKSKKP